MFDVGGWEFLFIAIIGIIVIGPKELPRAIKTASSLIRRMRKISSDFQSSLEDAANDTELKKVTEELGSITAPIVTGDGLKTGLENKIDSDGVLRETFKEDVYSIGPETDFDGENEVETKASSRESIGSQKEKIEKEEDTTPVKQENPK